MWTKRYLNSNESVAQLIAEGPKRLIELGVDSVLFRKDDYPEAYNALEHTGHSTNFWKTLSRESLNLMLLKSEESVEICGSLRGAECLDDLLRQARWWQDKGLTAHHWERYSAWCQECLLIEDNSISFSASALPKPELACMEMDHSLGTFGCADEKTVQVLFDLLGGQLARDAERRPDEPLDKFKMH